MRPLHYLLLLCSTVAVIVADEDVEIEGLETLVALSSPNSEEKDGDTKKARLTFFDDIEVVRPSNRLETDKPQLRYVSPPSTTIGTPTFTSAAIEETTKIIGGIERTTQTIPTSTVSISTTTATQTTPTTTIPAITTTEKKVEKLNQLQTQKPILIPIPLPSKEILQAIVETSEPYLIQLPFLPKVAGVLTAGQSIQGNPWGTETFPYQIPSSLTEYSVTVPPPVEIGSELDMGETSPFVPDDSHISQLPITPQIVEEKKGDGKMSVQDMEQAKILMTALRAMKSEVEETLRQINEGEKSVLYEETTTVPPPVTTTSIPSTTASSIPSTTTRTTTISTTTTTSRPVTTSSTTPSITTTTIPTTTIKITTTPTTPTAKTTTQTPTTTTKSTPPTTTRDPLPVDEVKSTEAVQIDSDTGEEKAHIIPSNDAVVVVDNSVIPFTSSRIEGYTKTVARVVDNDRPSVTKVYKKRRNDNSFLPSEENEFRPKKILTKKRHLIQNGEDVVVKITRRRLRKKVKKISSPTTPTLRSSPTTPSLPSSSSSPSPSTPLPIVTAPRRTLVPRAAPTQQFQVSPAAVHSHPLQQPAMARAAPIYRPSFYTTIQPQYYPPPPPPPPPPPVPQPTLQSFQQPFFDSRLQPQQSPQQLPLYQQQSQLPILRYEPVVYYRPVYGRKKREAMKKYELLFNRKDNGIIVRKGEESRFAALHSVISPSISTIWKKNHKRIFEKKDEKVVVKKVENVEAKNKTNILLPKSPTLRKSSFEPHTRTKRVKRGADLSEVNKELDEIERALSGNKKRQSQVGDKEERHTGVDELASELDMIEQMKGKGHKEIEEADLMEDEEDFDDEEEEIPEKEEEEKATPSYKKSPPSIEELKSLEDSVRVDHEQMKKHPQGELRLNKGERPKLFSHGRTITEQIRGTIESDDYEYDAQIADSFHLPASDIELEELYHQRLRAAELAPVSPTASPLRKRRHRTTPYQIDEVEVQAATRRRTRKRTTTTTTTTTEIPSTTRTVRRTRRPATIIPNFHPKEASSDSDSLASLPNIDDIETTTIRARGLRRDRHTASYTIATTTEIPETTTTIKREGRPARILPKKESAFALPAGGNRFFYDRDSVPQVVTRSPPYAPPTLTPPTLIPQQDQPTISPSMSIDELAVLPREALLQELKRLSEQLEEKIEETKEKKEEKETQPSQSQRDEDIVDEEDRELIDAIQNGEKNRKEVDPFEGENGRRETTTTTVAPVTKDERDLFSFALPSKQKGERLTIDDLVLSDDVNEASIGQDIDRILADVGVGDNSIGTRKRAIEAIMEFKKKKSGDSKAKKCQPTTCKNDKEEKIPKDDFELVSQLQAVNMKHPLAKDGKFSLFATNKKSYYILPDGRVLVVNEQSKLARTNSGEELHLDEESSEDSVPEYPPDVAPESITTTVLPTTVAQRRRSTTTVAPTTTKRRRTRPNTTTTPYPIEGSDYEDTAFESATISIRPKIPSLPPHLPPRMPDMKKVLLPWRTTASIPITTTTSIPVTTTTKRIYIHDGGIEPSQVSVFATPRTPPKSKILVHKDEEKKHFPRHQDSGIARIAHGAPTLENDLDTSEAEMTREELIKYLESIDIAKTFGGKNLQTPNDEKFDKAVTKTAEDEYSDDVEYEDSVTEEQRNSPSSHLNAPKSVDDIDLRKWFTIGKDNAAARAKKGDGIAESILEAASEVPDEEVAEDEFLAEESVNLFPDDFVRVLRSVAGGERVPMRMVRRLGLRLRAARLRRH